MKRFTGISMALAGAGMMLLASAAVAGDWCVNCHTMHNSQDGVAIGSTGPGNAQLLLSSTCLGCHTGTNNGVAQKHFVLDTAADPTATQLAGGNFYWTNQADTPANDAKAHNVTGLSVNGSDAALGLNPPGGGAALAGSFTCAGTTGCHGNRTVANEFTDLSGAHHANASGQITAAAAAAAAVALKPGQAFRFLGGIAGYEDPNREYAGSVTTALHNEYYGENRASDSAASTATISYLCAKCHPNFHNDSGGQALGLGASNFASPWLRHPTDFRMDMTAATEYTAYTFSNQAPVARSSVPASSSATVNNVAGTDAIVMCLSCHRAHGSPYADILRWDYSTTAGGGDDCISEIGEGLSSCGCFKCHTMKDN